MSNYPPGVTGHEYQIAGPDTERDESRTCGAENVEILTLSGADQRLLRKVADEIRAGYRNEAAVSLPVQVGRLEAVLASIEEVTMDVCPFDGDVTVQSYRRVGSWTCPLCHTEHVEEPDD